LCEALGQFEYSNNNNNNNINSNNNNNNNITSTSTSTTSSNSNKLLKFVRRPDDVPTGVGALVASFSPNIVCLSDTQVRILVKYTLNIRHYKCSHEIFFLTTRS
jgi:hypothetical protein